MFNSRNAYILQEYYFSTLSVIGVDKLKNSLVSN